MNRINLITKKTKLIVFDQYGTIVDMQKGLIDSVTPFLRKKNGMVILTVLLLGGEELILKIQ